ncbi:MAG: MgtC/SapB family protein [Myxococcota bacterium]|nr:MgtC/SapB family protein [Myxococcota bacterium]
METDGVLLLRTALAVVLAVPVGWDRERRARPAGLRTHLLVAASAAAFSGIALILTDVVDDSHARLDPIRAIEAIVAGIGFLGAGTIFISRDKVIGLTTAASLLATAALGTAAGMGRYLLAIGLAVLILIVLAVLHLLAPDPVEEPPPPEE